MAPLDFGILGGGDATLQTADYKSAGSHQAENLDYELVTDAGVYEEIFTVTTGKTRYISFILISFGGSASEQSVMATGAAASEVDFLITRIDGDPVKNAELTFTTPIKFPSGTRVSCKISSATDTHFVTVGWEE